MRPGPDITKGLTPSHAQRCTLSQRDTQAHTHAHRYTYIQAHGGLRSHRCMLTEACAHTCIAPLKGYTVGGGSTKVLAPRYTNLDIITTTCTEYIQVGTSTE